MFRGFYIILFTFGIYYVLGAGKYPLSTPVVRLEAGTDTVAVCSFVILAVGVLIGSVWIASDKDYFELVGFLIGFFSLMFTLWGLLVLFLMPKNSGVWRGYFFILCGFFYFYVMGIKLYVSYNFSVIRYPSSYEDYELGMQSSFLVFSASLIVGAIMLARDKGYTGFLGFFLGLLPPVGLLFLTLLPEKNQNATEQFKAVYAMIVKTRWWLGALFALINVIVLNLALKGASGAGPFSGVLILLSGVCAALALASALTMIVLVFAPDQWLTTDERGQLWLKRTRAQGETQIRHFRVMSAVIGSFALFWSLLTVVATVGVMLEL